MDANAKAQVVQSDFSATSALAKGIFDHLIRHSESYSEKWEYVRQNPVRAGLVNDPDKWPWQGEITRLEALQ
jgi:hypothetical protein